MKPKVFLRKITWLALRLLPIAVAGLLLSTLWAPRWESWLALTGRPFGLGSGCLLMLLLLFPLPLLLARQWQRRGKKPSLLSWVSVWNGLLVAGLLWLGPSLQSHGSWIFQQFLGAQHPVVTGCQAWLGWKAGGQPAGNSAPTPTPTLAVEPHPARVMTPTTSATPVLAEVSPTPRALPVESPEASLELQGGLVLVPRHGIPQPTASLATPSQEPISSPESRRAAFVTTGGSRLRHLFPLAMESVALEGNLDELSSPQSAHLEVHWFNDRGFTSTESLTTESTQFKFELARPAKGWVEDVPYGVELKLDGRSLGVRSFSFPSPKNGTGVDQFFRAIREGHLAKVKRLLKSDPGLKSSLGMAWGSGPRGEESLPSGDFANALHIAIQSEQGEIARFLMQSGVDVNLPSGTMGYTPLMLAAAHSDSQLVEMLLAAGASTRPADYLQLTTALHEAARAGQVENVRKLLKAGADPHATLLQSARRFNPADLTVVVKWPAGRERDYLECFQLLLDAGAEPPPLADGCGPSEKSTLILKELLRRGVPLESGDTKTLWEAVCRGQAEQVDLLCKAGADTSILVYGKPLTYWAGQSKVESPKKLAILERKLLKHGP